MASLNWSCKVVLVLYRMVAGVALMKSRVWTSRPCRHCWTRWRLWLQLFELDSRTPLSVMDRRLAIRPHNALYTVIYIAFFLVLVKVNTVSDNLFFKCSCSLEMESIHYIKILFSNIHIRYFIPRTTGMKISFVAWIIIDMIQYWITIDIQRELHTLTFNIQW